MGFDLGRAEEAVAAWLATATGLPCRDDDTASVVSRIIPKFAQTPNLPMPYLTYLVPPPLSTGREEQRKVFDPNQPEGLEVQVTSIFRGELTVTVNVYTERARGGPDADGFLSAGGYIHRVQQHLGLQSVRDQLRCAGLVLIDRGTPRDFSSLAGAVGQGRAVLEVRFRVTDTIAEGEGYISTVNPTVTAS